MGVSESQAAASNKKTKVSANSDLKLRGLVASTNFMNQCDPLKKGYVTFDDVKREYGANWTPQQLEDERLKFMTMDNDKDGKVNKNEYYKWFVKNEIRRASPPKNRSTSPIKSKDKSPVKQRDLSPGK
jgi:hypothetical protein